MLLNVFWPWGKWLSPNLVWIKIAIPVYIWYHLLLLLRILLNFLKLIIPRLSVILVVRIIVFNYSLSLYSEIDVLKFLFCFFYFLFVIFFIHAKFWIQWSFSYPSLVGKLETLIHALIWLYHDILWTLLFS